MPKLFSINVPEEEKKSQNEKIAVELAERLSDLLNEFNHDYEEAIPIINESLTKLARKDLELAKSIVKELKIMHNDVDKKFPFKFNEKN